MQLHLPPSPVDRLNQPPVYYLQVQDGLILSVMAFWTISYVLYVRQAYIDRSYGMPLLCLFTNIAWEFLFGLVVPTSAAQTVCFVPWLIIDVGIIYTTYRFGPEQWKQSPLVAQNLGWILITGTVVTNILFWTFINTVGLDAASFYIGYGDQLLISITSVAQLMARDHTRGHSWGIWFNRTMGTFVSLLLFSWRYWHYAASYPRVAEPTTVFMFLAAEIMDFIVYPAVYAAVDGKGQGRSSGKKSHVR